MLARYAAKCDKRRAGVGAVDERKQKKLDEQEASSVKQDRLGFNRQSGDLAEAQRADMDVISARKAIARSRMIPPHVDKKLLAKGNRALRRRKWLKANQCFDTVISKDAANEEAFLGKLLASVPARSVRELSGAKASFSTNRYYIVLQHIAAPALKAKLAAAAKKVDARLNRGEEEYERMTEKRVMNRRLRLTERRLRDSEARNRKLEVETERLRKNKTYEEVYGSFRYGEPSADGVARTGRFSGVAVVAFLIGAAVVTAFSIGVAVLFAKFGGDLSAFLAALGLG